MQKVLLMMMLSQSCWLALGCVGCIAIATSHMRMYMFYIQVYAAMAT